MLNLIQYYITEHTPYEKRRDVVASVTGPLLTDERRVAQRVAQAPDEPPMPDWWEEDDATESNITAARQLRM